MDKKYITINKGSSENEVTVVIEKDLSINNIDPIKNELNEIVSKHKTIKVELRNIDNFDLTSVQLLYALKKIPGKKVEITADIKEDLKNIIINSGFKEIIN